MLKRNQLNVTAGSMKSWRCDIQRKYILFTDGEIFSAGVVGLRIIYANEMRTARRAGDPRILIYANESI